MRGSVEYTTENFRSSILHLYRNAGFYKVQSAYSSMNRFGFQRVFKDKINSNCVWASKRASESSLECRISVQKSLQTKYVLIRRTWSTLKRVQLSIVGKILPAFENMRSMYRRVASFIRATCTECPQASIDFHFRIFHRQKIRGLAWGTLVFLFEPFPIAIHHRLPRGNVHC